ncbi:bifunctional EF-Hand 1 [Babesia duncani]|uniref:ubiquitinyl hydrolase 1 n=1 Tax=Babesia duncani TaxID=323732 RepID=A0AAD9PNC7_9APIC|nr:bifunctional EF-Hand 1 [Babesia duncani]
MAWIWNDPAFIELCCNDFFSFNAGSVIPVSNLSCTSSLNSAVKLMLRILNKSLEKCGSIITPPMHRSLLKAKEVMSTTDSALWQHLQDAITAAAGGNFDMLYRFIFGLLTRIRDLPSDSWLILPGGVLLSDETPLEWLCFAIYKPEQSPNYVFALINTGGLGVKYHSFRLDKESNIGLLQRDATIVLKDVMPDRLIHSAFWFLLYRLMYVPSIHNYETLYTVLLPFLNCKPILLNWRIENDLKGLNASKPACNSAVGSAKKLLVETFTKLKESHESKTQKVESTRDLIIELSQNVGGVWADVSRNEYKPNSMIQSIFAVTHLLLRQDEHSDKDIKLVQVIFQLSLCLLIDKELDALGLKEAAMQLSRRSVSLLVEITCKRLCVLVAEESLHGALKDDLVDLGVDDDNELSIETASQLSQLVGSMNSAFPSVVKIAGSLGQEREKLVYDDSLALNTVGDLYKLIATLVGKLYVSLQERLPSYALGMGQGSCTMDKQLCNASQKFDINFEFDHFGKFRLDGPNVNELARGSVVAQLVLPVDFTTVDVPIQTYTDVCRVLRHCIETCTLLSNQRDAIPYTYAWRFQLIKHVLFDLLPIPLPILPENEHRCFWQSMEIDRETQIDLCRLLQMLARHLALTCLSLVRTRVIEGEKGIMMATICAITDVVVRKIARGTPSKLSLLYSGKAQGPTTAFGFSLGNFATESSYYSLTSPAAVIARTQILDYFEIVTKDLDAQHTVFSWENNMEVSQADELLVHLMALQFGFYRNSEDIRKYLIGDCCEFSSILPEFDYLRDVVFIAKSIGWSGTFTGGSRYSLQDSVLKWSLASTGTRATVAVKAFGKMLKVAGLGKVRSFEEANATYYKKMIRWFGASGSSKTPSSAADPHNLAGDCEIDNETDVLHLSTLPDYDGKLGRRDSELLLQYLTASYVRIPLVTQFFADEANLHAVSCPEIQKVVTACVFEPGIWQSALGITAKPQTAPVQSPECLSTPLGLLFNEIYHSGSSVLAAIEKMLELALERDNCVYAGASSLVLPFAVRISANVCDYVRRAVAYYRTHSRKHLEAAEPEPLVTLDPGAKAAEPEDPPEARAGQDEDQPEARVDQGEDQPESRVDQFAFANGLVRGLRLQSEEACADLEAFQLRMRRLLLEAASALEKRAIKAARANEQNAASTAMAHVALVYRYILQIDVMDKREPPANTDSIVLSLTCALFFVFVHHQFTVERQLEGVVNENLHEVENEDDEPLAMPEIELFGYMQNVRTFLLDYLRKKGKEGSSCILEKLIERVSRLGMTKEEIESVEMHEKNVQADDLWQELQMPKDSGRFSRSSWIQRQLKSAQKSHLDEEENTSDDDDDDVLMDSFYVDDELEQAMARETSQMGWAFDSQTATGIDHETLQQDQMHQKQHEELLKKQKQESRGLLSSTTHAVMDQTKKTFDKSKVLGKKVYRKLKRSKKLGNVITPIEVYEDWLKISVMQHCDIEINFQTVEFALKKNKLQLLGPWVNQFPHFVNLMGPVSAKSTVQSVTVQQHSNRHWLKFVGRRYHLIRWEPDERDYSPPPKTLYKHSKCPQSLEWLPLILEPWLAANLPDWAIYINSADLEACTQNVQDNVDRYYKYELEDLGDRQNTIRLYAQYYASSNHTGEPKELDVPVQEFGQSPQSTIADATLCYIPHEPDTLVKFAKNASETISTISNVFTDAAASITKIGASRKFAKPEDKQEKEPEHQNSSKRCVTKEIIVTKDPPCISVYDIIEQGRTWYRSLVYSSDAKRSYCNSLARFVTSQSVENHKPTLVCGKAAMAPEISKRTLLIIRSQASGSVTTREQLVLPICLRGLVPEVLLEEYEFWQNLKTSDIVGYPKPTSGDRYAKTRLHIQLEPQGPPDSGFFQHADARATITRKLADGAVQTTCEHLVNLQQPRDGAMRSLVETLLRLDDLSHILAWSDSTQQRIDLIEFAKLGLTFRAVVTSNNTLLRYMCEEHNGLFLNYGDVWQSPLTASLIRGLENSLLLTDDDGELYILVSTVRRPLRIFPRVPNTTLVGNDIANILHGTIWPDLIYDGSCRDWLSALDSGSRHYLYKVHSSRSFLFVPTYAAGLYLLLNRFLNRQYEQVCRLSKTTLFDDGNLNGEERVFWQVLAKIDSRHDLHPDAYACRLYLLLAASRQGLAITQGIKMKQGRGFQKAIRRNLTSLKCVFTGPKMTNEPEQDPTSLVDWVLHEQLIGYICNLRHVSAGCRLSLQDEKELLSKCQSQFPKYPILSNRCQILEGIRRGSRGYHTVHAIEFAVPTKPSVVNYDDMIDKSAIEKNVLVDSAASAFTSIKFKRPETVLSGPLALQYIEKMFQRGIGLGDSLIAYELLIGVFPLNGLPSESSHCWGALLTRFICHKEPNTKSIILSTLKLLSKNPQLGSSMPKCPDDVMQTKKFSLLHLGSKQPIHKFMGEIQKTLSDLNDKRNLDWHDYKRNVHRSEHALRVDATLAAAKHLVPWAFGTDESRGCDRTQMTLAPCTVGEARVTPEFIRAQAGLVLGEVIDRDIVAETKLAPPADHKELPIDLSGHWIRRYAPARRVLARLAADYEIYLNEQTERARNMQFVGFSTGELEAMVGDAALMANGLARLQRLRERLLALFRADGHFVESGIRCALREANSISPGSVESFDQRQRLLCWCFLFGKLGGLETLVGLDQLIECLVCVNGKERLLQMNPFISDPGHVLSLVAAVMLGVIRRTFIARSISQLMASLVSLKKLSNPSLTLDQRSALCTDICTSTGILSERINARRHYMTFGEKDCAATFDPRFLLFEFSSNLMLHKRQVELVGNFVESASRRESCCHQLIMGEGKTTVVGPLLSVMLADGERLFVQSCPQALLEFTRATLRETFSAVIHKNVYTLNFTRFDRATPELYLKLLQARQTRAIVICTPTSIKSIFLRVIHCFHKLDSGALEEPERRLGRIQQRLAKVWNMQKLVPNLQTTAKGARGATESTMSAADLDQSQRSVQLELDMCLRLLELFSSAILLMDEIDLLMHPLKSELHWPIGDKKPLVHLRNCTLAVRWLLPWHMLRVMLPQTQQQVAKSEAHLLDRIRAVLAQGVANCNMADSPHLVLLNMHWYNSELRPLMAEWVHYFLRSNNLVTEPHEHILNFLNTGKPNLALSSIQVLNFCKEWLWSTFPHVIQRVNLVNYGVLDMKQVEDAMAMNPNVPQTRKMLAVPFVGKGTPSKDSEFSHPDVLIGFTILAYKYQGLRMSDFVLALRALAQQFYSEPGRPQDRPSYKAFDRWVRSAGARTKTAARTAAARYHYLGHTDYQAVNDHKYAMVIDEAKEGGSACMEVWTLDAVNVFDDEQVGVLYELLQRDGLVIEYYLNTVLFPVAMEHTTLQLTASAHELGSSMLFAIRLGFSGTPSQLLPAEMGGCHYSPGTDGKILKILSDDSVVRGLGILPKGWTSESILDFVASSPLKPLALIDTGALVTNFTNLQVAKQLLQRGLNHVDGVVYLDDQDRQVILLRDKWRSVLLSHCGIPKERRFCFYDQVHSTGQDISQAAHAMAFITIGADMTFRDYSQGAWRMRGIGKGQTLHLIIPREVHVLISTDQQQQKSQIIKVLQWLLVRGICAEIRHSQILLEHSVLNIIRKRCFQTLIEDHLNISSENPNLARCVQVFRELKDFGIPTTFARRKTLQDKLKFLMQTHAISGAQLAPLLKAGMCHLDLRGLELAPSQAPLVPPGPPAPLDIFAPLDEDVAADDEDPYDLAAGQDHGGDEDVVGDNEELDYGAMAAELEGGDFEFEAEHEQEMEWEQEQEQEATHLRQQMKEEEHATELEAAAPHRYSRSDEHLLHWNLDALARPGEDGQGDPGVAGFTPCKHFYLYRKDASKLVLPFPDYILISPNFYKLKWSANSYRRLKNVICVLDVAHASGDIDPSEPGPLDSVVDATRPPGRLAGIPAATTRRVARALDILAPDTRALPLPLALAVVEATTRLAGHDARLLTAATREALCSHTHDRLDQVDEAALLRAMEGLFAVDPGRRFVIVTLAEAEAIRAWLHWRGDGLGVKLALRHLSARFQPFDASRAFAPTLPEKVAALVGLQPRIAQACLKFLNSEFHYTPAQVQLLQECLAQSSLQDRMSFFQSTCEMRLVIQNFNLALAGAKELQRLFEPTRLDEVAVEFLSLKVLQALAECGGPQPFLQKLGINQLTLKKLDGLVNGTKQVATAAEMARLFQVLDRDKDGTIGLQDLEAALEAGGLLATSSLAGATFALVAHETRRRVASCKLLSAWAPKQLDGGHPTQNAVQPHTRMQLAHTLVMAEAEKSGPAQMVQTLVLSTRAPRVALDEVVQPPLGFEHVWQDALEGARLHLWRATPPEGLVALGLAATSHSQEPGECEVACVPASWTMQVPESDTRRYTLEEPPAWLCGGAFSLEAGPDATLAPRWTHRVAGGNLRIV